MATYSSVPFDCRGRIQYVAKTIFDDDFMLSDFAEVLLKGWANTIPPKEPISRDQFNQWVEKLNHYLTITADAHFKRLEEMGILKEAEKHENLY